MNAWTKITAQIRKYLNRYRFNSVLFRNMRRSLIFTTILTLCISFLSLFVYYRTHRAQIYSYCEKFMTEIATSYNAIIDEAYAELLYYGINPEVEVYLSSKENAPINSTIQHRIFEVLKRPVVIKNYVRSVFVYAKNSGTIITDSRHTSFEDFQQQEIVNACIDRPKGVNVVLTDVKIFGVSQRYLSVVHDIQNGANTVGLAIMNLDRTLMASKINTPDYISYYILSGDDIWLTSDTQNVNLTREELLRTYENTAKTYCFSAVDDTSGLEYLVCLDLGAFTTASNKDFVFVIVFILILFWISICFSFVTSIQMFKPIDAIVESLDAEYAANYLDIPLGQNELEYITNALNLAVSSHQELSQELSYRISLLKKAQSIALQSQINPHFINNTLDTINWMAISALGGRNEISDMTGSLSKMLRFSLESDEMIVPIRVELDYCKDYLKIQEHRYRDKFEIIWDIDPAISECKIVKLSIQPIIENAIYHGIKPLSGKGIIAIRGKRIQQQIQISIEDNGMGMNEETLHQLRLKLESDVIAINEHIGLSNVNQRLKLLFGEEGGLHIDSTQGVGTTVTFFIPEGP